MRSVLTLIRHGLTDWNVEGRFQGQTDRPLSEEGRRQARRLASRTTRFGPVTIQSSPLTRAVETARIAFPGQQVACDPRLQELDFGAFEGRTLEENQTHPAWNDWMVDPYERPTPGGESYRDLRERMAAWYDDLPSGDAHHVAVAHSGSIQMLLAHLLGLEKPRWRKRIYLRHSSVTRVVRKDGVTVIERVNDTRHLDENGADPFWE
ncbi:MAG: histidine phosphatase family protein [Trueperaceae bacterium]